MTAMIPIPNEPHMWPPVMLVTHLAVMLPRERVHDALYRRYYRY